METKKRNSYVKGFFLLLILGEIISCLHDEKENLAEVKSKQNQKASVFTTASREEIQAFIKEEHPSITNKENTNGENEEKVISPLRYVKLFGQEAEAGILRVSRGDKIAQWVFYKQYGKLQANRVRALRQPGTDSISSFTGIVEVSELKGIRWASYVYRKDTLKKVYSGNGLLSPIANSPCEKRLMSKTEEDEAEENTQAAYAGGDCGGGGSGTEEDPYQVGMVVVTAHSGSSGSSSGSWGSGSSGGSSGTGWGSGGGYPSGTVGGYGSGGGGGSYSGDDGDSYYGGEIGEVVVKGHKKAEPEEEEEDSDESLPLLPLSGLADEKGAPLKEKQEPPEKKEEDKKEPCKTTAEDLQKVFPKTDSGTLKEIADLVNEHGKDFGINDDETLRYFISQVGAETKNMTEFTEGTTYHLSRLNAVWPRKFNTIEHPTANPKRCNPNDFTRSKGSTLADPIKLFNYVYADKNRSSRYRLGNTQSGDGYKYRGRGTIQITGREAYAKFNTFYQQHYDKTVNLIDNPDLVATDCKIRVISGLWYFKQRVNSIIKQHTKYKTDKVSKAVNGGRKGSETRSKLYEKAQANVKCH